MRIKSIAHVPLHIAIQYQKLVITRADLSPAVETPDCPHGPAIIDECNNVCRCAGSGYSCPRGSCRLGQVTGKPLTCPSTGSPRDLPRVEGYRVFCHNGVVKIQRPSRSSCRAKNSPDVMLLMVERIV